MSKLLTNGQMGNRLFSRDFLQLTPEQIEQGKILLDRLSKISKREVLFEKYKEPGLFTAVVRFPIVKKRFA